MVATAANTYISGSQFTFKWNFNIGERSHTESLIYRKPVLHSEEQCSLLGQERKETSGNPFVFSVVYSHLHGGTKRRGWGRGEGEVGDEDGPHYRLCQFPRSWGNHDGCFGLELSSSTTWVVPTSGHGELFFSGQMGEGASYGEPHHPADGLYGMDVSSLNRLWLRAVRSWAHHFTLWAPFLHLLSGGSNAHLVGFRENSIRRYMYMGNRT